MSAEGDDSSELKTMGRENVFAVVQKFIKKCFIDLSAKSFWCLVS